MIFSKDVKKGIVLTFFSRVDLQLSAPSAGRLAAQNASFLFARHPVLQRERC